ncbi:MAG: putative integrase [Candidatus Saccharibacteria bacterium GW2011_GWC2_48_9]|nr:MAG: putative integrase [Candidatus Saccharibacteria bacterium GW2011_GWC2_48_9]HCH34390.1 integrase [Candidatus Saccharibacteria bacterium]
MKTNDIVIRQSRMMSIFDSMDITENTKQDYLARLPRLIKFIERNGIDRDLLLSYKKSLRDDVTLGVSAKNKYLTTARIALRELYRQGKFAIDLSVGVKSFQQSNKHKVIGLNREEVEAICNYLQTLGNSLQNIRLKAIVALLLFQGLRQIEICRLDVEDIDLANSRIYIVGKGRTDREPIHIHPETHKVLTQYLRRSQVKYGPLFTHLNRQPHGNRLSTRGLRMIFQNLLELLNIHKTTHGTRHYFTTELIRHFQSDLATVAKFTRHSSLEMLNVYNDEILDKKKMNEVIKALPFKI